MRSRGNYSSLTQMQKSIVPCSYEITWKLFKPYPNVEKYCAMLLSDQVETIQALPKCRKGLYHAPIRSRGNYSSLTQMQKSIVPCSYQITWKLFSLTQIQKSIVPCSYQITWRLFRLTQMQKSIVPCSYEITWKLFSLTQMQKSIVPCSYQITWKLFKSYPNVKKYCTMLLSDHVETIQPYPTCRKVLYHAPIRSRGNYSSLTQMQKSIVPCSYQITWKLFKPYPNVEKYCTMLLSHHVETIQPYPHLGKA